MRSVEQRKNDLEKLFQKNPGSPYYAHLADCFLESGNEDELERAEAILEIGIKKYPKDVNGHFVLGKYYYKVGNVKSAKSELERTLKYYPTHIGAYELLLKLNEEDGLQQVNENLKNRLSHLDPVNPILTGKSKSIKPIDFSNIDSDVEEIEDDDNLIDTSVFDEQLESENDPVIEPYDFDNDSGSETNDFEDIAALSEEELEALQNEIGGMIHNKKVKELSQEEQLDELFGDEVTETVDKNLPVFEEEVIEEKDESEEKKEAANFFSLTEEKLFEDDSEYLEKLARIKGESIAIENLHDDHTTVIDDLPTEDETEIEADISDEDFTDLSSEETESIEGEVRVSSTSEMENTSIDDEVSIDNEIDEEVFSMSDLDEDVSNSDIFEEPDIQNDKELETKEIDVQEKVEEELPFEEEKEEVFSINELDDKVQDDTIFESKLEIAPKPELSKVSKLSKREKLPEVEKIENSEEPQIVPARVLKPEDVNDEEVTKLEDYVTTISKENDSNEMEENPIPTSIFQDDLLSDELEMLTSDNSQEPKEEAADDSALLSPTLGEIHMAQGRFEEARVIFIKLLEKNPNDEKLKRKILDIDEILNG